MHHITVALVLSIIVVVVGQQQHRCPDGFDQSSVLPNKCFHIERINRRSYVNAKIYCQDRDPSATLISIGSAFENSEIYANLYNTDNVTICDASGYWIGAVDEAQNGQFTWIDGQSFAYVNWDTNEPNVNYYHVAMVQSNGRWKTGLFVDEKCFICEAFKETSTTSTTITTTSSTTTTTTTTTTTSSTTTTTTTTTTTSSTTTTTTTTTTTSSTTITLTMTDCDDWRLMGGATTDGIYRIDPGHGLAPFDVYCDMHSDGGGWTVIQRRVDESLEFYDRSWRQYKEGFNNGLTNGNLWLGNDRIHVLSRLNNDNTDVVLRIEIFGDNIPNSAYRNIYLYGDYFFSISDESTNYTLRVSQPIAGNASYYSFNGNDEFYANNAMSFSTGDRETNYYGSTCAVGPSQFGGWWHNHCTNVALNGKYRPSAWGWGFRWWNEEIAVINPIRSVMKIRRHR